MSTKRLVYIAIFVALITIGGLISVPIPFTQIEISLSTLFVISAGLVLGGRDGALAVLVYIVMGLLGLPVFTQGGGLGYIFTPSFGYLIGFPIGAFLAGTLKSKAKDATKGKVFLCALVGIIPVYVFGITYQVLILYYYTGVTLAAALGGVPAVLVLMVKDAVLMGCFALFVYPSLKKVFLDPRT